MHLYFYNLMVLFILKELKVERIGDSVTLFLVCVFVAYLGYKQLGVTGPLIVTVCYVIGALINWRNSAR